MIFMKVAQDLELKERNKNQNYNNNKLLYTIKDLFV